MQNNAGFKNKLELWDRTKNKYDWENEDLDVSDGKVEVEPVNAYPHIPAEIPGVLMEYNLQPDEGAVQEKGYQMCFDLEPGKMVLRRNIKKLSIP